MPLLSLQDLVKDQDLETKPILTKLIDARVSLANVAAISRLIPNQNIIVNAINLQEAKLSSEIENIVTTHDEMFRSHAQEHYLNPATKEAVRHKEALLVGLAAVKEHNLLTINTIIKLQQVLKQTDAEFRQQLGTTLKNNSGEVIYTPPHPNLIANLMLDLERFINDDQLSSLDRLIKMALIHHQFESIHPFYDGNGRTGRMINVLYLVKTGLLDQPVIYLSAEILKSKNRYYQLLQEVREQNNWHDWIIYILECVDNAAQEAFFIINNINNAMLDFELELSSKYHFYSKDLLYSLFLYPYTKIEFIQRDLNVTRITARSYLEKITADGLLNKQKYGRTNYYINYKLIEALQLND